jgi:DNA-binding GntR family transcriptional regulator
MRMSAPREGRPETSVPYAKRRIKEAIADGTITPGARLSPHLLAPVFGVSHIPIREALASLMESGYVEHRQGKGYFARKLTSEDLADVYHWREVIEREAYIMAVPKLVDDDIAEMARLVQQMSRLTGPEDRAEYLELNRQFHFIVFRRAGSRRLLRFLNYLWDSAQPYAVLGNVDSAESHRQHLELIPIFAARDTDAVIAAMNKHREVRVRTVAEWEAAQVPVEDDASSSDED